MIDHEYITMRERNTLFDRMFHVKSSLRDDSQHSEIKFDSYASSVVSCITNLTIYVYRPQNPPRIERIERSDVQRLTQWSLGN